MRGKTSEISLPNLGIATIEFNRQGDRIEKRGARDTVPPQKKKPHLEAKEAIRPADQAPIKLKNDQKKTPIK